MLRVELERGLEGTPPLAHAVSKVVYRRQHQEVVRIAGFQRQGLIDSLFGVSVPAHPQVHEPEIRVPQGLLRCKLDELEELGLRLLQPVLFQVGQAQCPGGEHVGHATLVHLTARGDR